TMCLEDARRAHEDADPRGAYAGSLLKATQTALAPSCPASAAVSRRPAWPARATAPPRERTSHSSLGEPVPATAIRTAPRGAVVVAASPDGSAALFLERGEHGLAGRRAVLGVLQREVHGGLDQADVRAAVEAPPLEVVGVDVAPGLDRRGDRVGQLDLAAGA